ncbi:MAG TPA: multidrug efflux MFS transporter, partial [Firmicutes bacterium]|nr:multidrug efflux MFS transporter [Bacillota bacterium]
SIGGVTGPVLGGAMGDRLGLASPFFGSAGLLAVAAVWLWADRAGVAKVREWTAAVG